MKIASLLLVVLPLAASASTIVVTPEMSVSAGLSAQGPLTVSASFDSTPVGEYSLLKSI